jgi:hypothetical protein
MAPSAGQLYHVHGAKSNQRVLKQAFMPAGRDNEAEALNAIAHIQAQKTAGKSILAVPNILSSPKLLH